MSIPSARRLALLAALVLAGAVGTAVALWQSGGDGGGEADPGPVHVHGLGVDPADGSLFIATHSGLYRVAEGEERAERVGERLQDTMGFTVVGPNRFLGSGHPDLDEAREEDLPPHLGLIESGDAGRSWERISLLGEADFHVLRSSGDRIYGYDASNDRLLASGDRGRTWNELSRPGPILDLAVAPLRPGRLVAVSLGGPEEGLFESRDGGRSWRQLGTEVGLLAWPALDRLHLVTGDGEVRASSDGGRSFERRGRIGGQPAAFLARGENELYVALHDGSIKRSTDGGATWTLRSTP